MPNSRIGIRMEIRMMMPPIVGVPFFCSCPSRPRSRMVGMMSFYFNIAHPDLFAASLFVSSQWDTSKMQDFGKKKFFYIVASGDQKASGGMRDLAEVLKENNARIDSASWSAKLPSEEQERLAVELIARGGNINFIKWETGSVLPETGRAMEHNASFDYGYKIATVRDWLFRQSK